MGDDSARKARVAAILFAIVAERLRAGWSAKEALGHEEHMNLSSKDIERLEKRKADAKRPLSESHPALAKAGLLLLGVCVFAGAVSGLRYCSAAHAAELSLAQLSFKRARFCAPAYIRVVDGDTIICRDKHVRIVGLDTPELHVPCQRERGLAAKAALTQLVSPPHRVLIREARTLDKYGRTLGIVLSDGQDVAKALIAQGLAHPYNGGTRPPWC